MNYDEDVVTGLFMCRTDFECELGASEGGNVVYPSESNARERIPNCVKQCGLVEVEVRLVRVVEEGNLFDEEN